jgi:hypothetical protein
MHSEDVRAHFVGFVGRFPLYESVRRGSFTQLPRIIGTVGKGGPRPVARSVGDRRRGSQRVVANFRFTGLLGEGELPKRGT